ncbi:HlyD family secretion protein [Pseudogulbenkiania ferrooxidans]|uniref:Secretion protein HlyD family protein n=1 Tax=Pseudogulbenkiania ferrooxidans 2002 TaxID=279714 RepID=B9Z4J6_9NEIS|nr:HlyD family efflux transporter periplasmic adaptor subunit [Pseudogulbenkiania ferrooxidans]EEG08078.1 secretion protein HlyD family protein [Pseudogulbenkiania ferrooxidans 2002]
MRMLGQGGPRLAATALALLLTACNQDTGHAYQGYIEGDYLYLAAPAAGYLQTLDTARGSRVQPGSALFAIAPDPEQQGLQEAEARVQSAEQKLQNLQEPRRPPEIAAIEAQLQSAEAALRLTATQLRQQQALARQGFISQAKLDEVTAAHDQAVAQADALRQQLKSAQITLGRPPEVRGARAELEAARAQQEQKRWQVEKKAVRAPAAGEIVETYYRPGEWVPAGQPVASLLPDNRRRLRFFVPESVVGTLRPGQAVEARCDGCPAPIRATVAFIAAQAEYTPPVIYSRGSREKLVFRVEAYPAPQQAAALRPGLPVDVSLVGR